MNIDREKLYRFPWSKTDNPGGWVEVTDECNLTCEGCYRHKLEGHRPLNEVKDDIIACQRVTRCDSMAIAGGEPLIYPDIVEVVDFIARRKMKPMILTNGENLTWDMAKELKKAGLAKFHFHVDCGQERANWMDKNEAEMNQLRQYFADLVWELGGVQCGYNVTIYRSSLKYIPEIIEWCQTNIHKVQHISLIAYRALPESDRFEYQVNGEKIDTARLQFDFANPREINITSEEMYAALKNRFPGSHPCAYLNGSSAANTYKYLIIVNVGSRNKIYGVLGAKTIQLAQLFYHLFKGRYCAFLKNPRCGRKIFLLSLVDKEVKKSSIHFLKVFIRNPLRLLDRIYTQSIHFQQPNEIYKGEANLCDGCANMMIYKGKLINSCRLDEYRLFGSTITQVPKSECKGKASSHCQ